MKSYNKSTGSYKQKGFGIFAVIFIMVIIVAIIVTVSSSDDEKPCTPQTQCNDLCGNDNGCFTDCQANPPQCASSSNNSQESGLTNEPDSSGNIQTIETTDDYNRKKFELDICLDIFKSLGYYNALCIEPVYKHCGTLNDYYKAPKSEFGEQPSRDSIGGAIDDAFEKMISCYSNK